MSDTFWEKVDKGGPVPTGRPGLGPCWLWTGGRQSKGYGGFSLHRRSVLAHRFTYERLVGPVPDGLELDHLCRVRHCVNPEHLEPVTHRVNIRRGDAGQETGRQQRAKTHCPSGHPYDVGNTYWRRQGWRGCRACQRAARARKNLGCVPTTENK